jgi:anti-sigma regulatory factor (Ser/Thr protein kinase)
MCPIDEHAACPSTDALTVPVSGMADATVASSLAVRFAMMCGFERREAVEIGIDVRDMATNIVVHSGSAGTIELSFSSDELVMRALDEGPGMADPGKLLADRPPPFVAIEGLGQGGGAIRRLADGVRVENRPSGGLEVEAVKRRAVAGRRE